MTKEEQTFRKFCSLLLEIRKSDLGDKEILFGYPLQTALDEIVSDIKHGNLDVNLADVSRDFPGLLEVEPEPPLGFGALTAALEKDGII